MSRRRKLSGVFERATTFEAVRAAALRAARGLRRRRDVARWLADLEPNVCALQRALHDGSWRPGPLRTFRIRDPKPRTIAVAPFSDRVVHHALCHELLPMFERFAIRRRPAALPPRPCRGPRRATPRGGRAAAAGPV